ncbi:hypothetical protein Bccel_2773 [Pseudobacteroides cellulosolvens ATCC 35603 = DSM 2933]|uniref:Uncharacterized protein n=1 Tax=Pseudobacteroides cellulosolvens ATCC 35603 = DSM 2933 TaxID=398512 RepID=A0A0L6JQ54_9FIRM|nr:hypothetical protein Bccel_2773 [Pseudobacteroides cellulosolvens ATCC 35603 = DSM 2933]
MSSVNSIVLVKYDDLNNLSKRIKIYAENFRNLSS